jgi:hypothetical protein
MRLNYGWKLWTAVVLLFFAGVLVGASGARYYFLETRQFMQPPDSPEHVREQILDRMDRKLDLRPDQHDAIAQYIQETMEKGRLIMDRFEPQMDANIQEQYQRIMNVLDPDQQQEFKKMHQRFEHRRKRFRRPFHSGHRPGHGPGSGMRQRPCN